MHKLRLIGFAVTVSMFMALFLNGCPKTDQVAEEIAPADTMAAVEVDTTPETPPPPPPKLKESQLVTLYFDLDKHSLRTDARTALDENYKLMTEFPDVMIKIEGHCDERGTIEYNLSLGEKRANAAMDYLASLGVAPERMSIISYGKESPVDTGSNEKAWSKNRRCEFRIMSQ